MTARTSIQKFPKGAVIFREGAPGAEAYIIVSGLVEVYREGAKGRKILSRMGPGQVFGELALILEKPRTASVVALEETVVRRVPAEVFDRILSASSKKMAPLMRTLFERLRTMNARLIAEIPAAPADGYALRKPAAPKPPEETADGPRRLRLIGLTAEAEKVIEEAEGRQEIQNFPFKIGRKSGSVFSDLMAHNDLYVVDREPFQVSRSHCAINKLSPEEERYFVQDRGSHMGTVVNGLRLGGTLEQHEAELVPGRNQLILGSDLSPYRFELIVEAA